MAIKGEDCGAAAAVREEPVEPFRGQRGQSSGHARPRSCLISQVINLDLQRGREVELAEQLEVS